MKWHRERPRNVHSAEIFDINRWCVLLYTMPTLEGELTSIYSKLDCQELLLFSCEIPSYCQEQKLCPKTPAAVKLSVDPNESVVCQNKVIDHSVSQKQHN